MSSVMGRGACRKLVQQKCTMACAMRTSACGPSASSRRDSVGCEQSAAASARQPLASLNSRSPLAQPERVGLVNIACV